MCGQGGSVIQCASEGHGSSHLNQEAENLPRILFGFGGVCLYVCFNRGSNCIVLAAFGVGCVD